MAQNEVLLIAVLIFGAAVLYSSVGQAGVSGYLAVMALFAVAPSVMKPTALVLNILVASIAVFRFGRAGMFSWAIFWPFVIGSAPLAFVGGAIQLPGSFYRPLVGIVLFVSAVRLIWTSGRVSTERPPEPPVLPAAAAGAGIGLLSGLTGTGGGIFLSPLLMFARWAETKETAGVSAAFILVNSIAGIAGHMSSVGGLPSEWPYWAVAAVAGGLVGTEIGVRQLAARGFRIALAVVLIIAGLKLMLT